MSHGRAIATALVLVALASPTIAFQRNLPIRGPGVPRDLYDPRKPPSKGDVGVVVGRGISRVEVVKRPAEFTPLIVWARKDIRKLLQLSTDLVSTLAASDLDGARKFAGKVCKTSHSAWKHLRGSGERNRPEDPLAPPRPLEAVTGDASAIATLSEEVAAAVFASTEANTVDAHEQGVVLEKLARIEALSKQVEADLKGGAHRR